MTADRGSCLIIDVGGALQQQFTRSISASGFAVALLTDQVSVPEASGALETACRFNDKAAIDAGFDRAVAAVGAPQVVVISIVPRLLMQALALVELPFERWTDLLHTTMLSTLYTLQSCHRVLMARGGVIVFTAPVLSLVGAAGYVALSTLLEAQRAMAKSAARQWGRLSIRTHWIALGHDENYPDLQAGVFPAVPELGPPPPALARVPTLALDIAPLIDFLSGHGAKALTGTTLVADGGNWMLP